MHTIRIAPLAALPLLLLACSPDEQQGNSFTPQNNGAASVETVPPSENGSLTEAANAVADTGAALVAGADEAAYLGKWIGVEGMVMTVTKKPGGGVTIVNQWSLDDKGTYDGSVTAEGLRFVRNGVPETAVLTDGDATGLKWLAGKKTCLTVKDSEGYCRD